MVDHIIFLEYHNHISYSQLSIPNSIIYYDVTERSRFSYPRVTANRFDLTLQGRPNQHDTCKPRRAHTSTISIVTTTSESRLLKPRYWAPHGELPENPKVASIQHPPTPTPSVAVGIQSIVVKWYTAYRFRLPPTSGMWLVLFNP